MTNTYCDKCGKIMGVRDKELVQIETPYKVYTADLCWECFIELTKKMEELVESYGGV